MRYLSVVLESADSFEYLEEKGTVIMGDQITSASTVFDSLHDCLSDTDLVVPTTSNRFRYVLLITRMYRPNASCLFAVILN